MLRNTHALVSSALFTTVLFTGLFSAQAFATEPAATGLGQSWPSTADVSTSPHYHVYVFARDGVRYIQVNDLAGTVRGAVAMADNEVLVLPVGVDAPKVTVSSASTATPKTTGYAENVYSDGVNRITAAPASNGTVQLTVVPALLGCPYHDPSDCTGNVISQIGN
ncbi:hypothetical protein [Dyella acidiphila]|uniref:Uncharacterized protein n=1 Tax=Dyella acidiphila TaxID=2775866 RepID=A0ABR9GFQ8_9GAMM|nr:hypothetical protein [Dyella acidiphila]MBE1162868.1 hypothetical protein [Dyella acidiphila]